MTSPASTSTQSPWPAPVTGRRLVCDSVDYNDKLRVFLDFDKSGASGDLEVFLQDMYPPLTLVSTPFRVTSKSGKATLLSDLDGQVQLPGKAGPAGRLRAA